MRPNLQPLFAHAAIGFALVACGGGSTGELTLRLTGTKGGQPYDAIVTSETLGAGLQAASGVNELLFGQVGDEFTEISAEGGPSPALIILKGVPISGYRHGAVELQLRFDAPVFVGTGLVSIETAEATGDREHPFSFTGTLSGTVTAGQDTLRILDGKLSYSTNCGSQLQSLASLCGQAVKDAEYPLVVPEGDCPPELVAEFVTPGRAVVAGDEMTLGAAEPLSCFETAGNPNDAGETKARWCTGERKGFQAEGCSWDAFAVSPAGATTIGVTARAHGCERTNPVCVSSSSR